MLTTKKELLQATEVITPYDWEKYNLTVVRDGYLEDGTRVHGVKEKLKREPIRIGGAYVVSCCTEEE